MAKITWDDEAQNISTTDSMGAQEPSTDVVNKSSVPSSNITWESEPVQPEVTVPKQQGDFFDRITKLARNRNEEMQGAIKQFGEGNIGLGSMLLQVVGKGGYGTAADIVGETVATGLSSVTPDAIEEPIKQYAYELFGKAYNSDIGKAIAEEWNKLDPNTQKNIEATGNILSWAAPKLKAKVPAEKLKGLGNAIEKSRISKKLKLPDTPSNRLDEAKRAFKDPYGFDDIVEEVNKVKGVSSNNSTKKNIIVLNKEIDNTDKELFRQLRKRSVDIADEAIDQNLDLELANMFKRNSFLQSDASIAKAVDDNLSSLQKIIDKYPKTPQGLIRARREFDKRLSEKIKGAPEYELIARDAVSKSFRRALNNTVIEAAPYADVKGLLNKQSKLFGGIDNLAQNYALEKPSLTELTQLVKQHPIITLGALSGTGAGFAFASSPVVLGASGAGALLSAGYRATPSALKGTGALLSAANKVTDVSQLSTNLDRLPLLRSTLLYGNEQEQQNANPQNQ
jgi:hypothetical protein